jgi:hypothetical protein
MKVKMLKSVPAAKDGIHVEQLAAGQVVELEESNGREMDLALRLIADKHAVVFSPEQEAADAKAAAEALAKVVAEQAAAKLKKQEEVEAKKLADAQKLLEAAARKAKKQPAAADSKPDPAPSDMPAPKPTAPQG